MHFWTNPEPWARIIGRYWSFSLRLRTSFFPIRVLPSLSLLFDAGCLVLIWLVQLIVYPSFTYMGNSQFNTWHSKYTFLIALIVFPLMLGQLIIAGLDVLRVPSVMSLGKIVLILSIWAVTFLIFVPLHQKLGKSTDRMNDLNLLTKRNWIRTVLWSIVFLLSLITNVIPWRYPHLSPLVAHQYSRTLDLFAQYYGWWNSLWPIRPRLIRTPQL